MGGVNLGNAEDCCIVDFLFALKLKGAVYKSYARPATLLGSEAWCLMESEMGIL